MSQALSIQQLAKAYVLAHRETGGARYARFSDVLSNGARRLLGMDRGPAARSASRETFWALEDVSMDVRQGERVGIIGRNGAGKSTLLKVISRITAPTRGRIEIAGRVASLLEVGTGFHPELTGRENIFLNGAVLGMSRSDIRAKFSEIVEFAEVERFLDTPVKRYSSGMYMRLAFAVAAHLEPDILIVDEVLAVGDAAFQKKCLGKMKDVGNQGRTVLFVSHNMGAIAEFCDRAVLLQGGRVVADGPTSNVIAAYAAAGAQAGKHGGVFEYEDDTSKACQIRKITVTTDEGQPSVAFEMSQSIRIRIEYTVREAFPELQFALLINKDGLDLFQAFDNDQQEEILPTPVGRHAVTYELPAWTLKEGEYRFRVETGSPTELLDQASRDLGFEVVNHTVSALKKSYRADRAGLMISPGRWMRSGQ